MPSIPLSQCPSQGSEQNSQNVPSIHLLNELSSVDNGRLGLYVKIVTCHLGFGMDAQCLESSFYTRERGDSVKSLGSGNKGKIES